MYHYFMQKNAVAHTANFLMDTLEAVASYISTFELCATIICGGALKHTVMGYSSRPNH